MTLTWLPPAYNGDRHVAKSGYVTVGAVFPPIGSQKKWRWRIWIGDMTHAADGSDKTEALAKFAVATRFQQFLDLAGLQALEQEIHNGN